MSKKCPACGKSQRPIFGALYAKLFVLANKNNQTIGEKHDIYVTLEQVHEMMREIVAEEGGYPI